VRAAERTAAQLLSYRSMAGDADPRLELWEVLHDQSVAADLDPGARASFDRAVTSGIAARLRAIELPRPRRVVLTSDDTTIPLRFRNDLPFDVTVRVDARSSRLDLGDAASSEILLVPGENRIDLPVEVQAPGETLLRLEVRAPDGGLVVGSVAVPVRSTAISGVGAALSVLSVTFLVGWWILTHRRNRRRAARSTGRHPVSGPAPDDPGTPVGASTGEGVQRRG
jgi:hypothetical protein